MSTRPVWGMCPDFPRDASSCSGCSERHASVQAPFQVIPAILNLLERPFYPGEQADYLFPSGFDRAADGTGYSQPEAGSKSLTAFNYLFLRILHGIPLT